MPLSYQAYGPILILVIIGLLSVVELVKYIKGRHKHPS